MKSRIDIFYLPDKRSGFRFWVLNIRTKPWESSALLKIFYFFPNSFIFIKVVIQVNVIEINMKAESSFFLSWESLIPNPGPDALDLTFRLIIPNHQSPPVLRIHDILGWIRIRIRRSMPLTNGSGSGSCYFRHLPSRCQPKTNFLTQFFLLIFF